MVVLNVLLILCSIHSLVNGVGFHGFTFRGLEEPEPIGPKKKDVIEGWIFQMQDHFNPRNKHMWAMRYYENSAFLKSNGPIFIMIGGEWEIATGFLLGGLMYEIASAHGGIMYYTEHRFYGHSRPTRDTSAENLQYLNADQALADLAYFITTKKKEKNLESSPVIVFGCSYAGSLAAWARLKYPHLIQGALASSAPVYAKADFYEYYEVVTRSLGRHDKQCVTDIKIAFKSVQKLLAEQYGHLKLKYYFNLCKVPDVNSSSDLSYLTNALAEVFGEVVQYNNVNKNGRTRIAESCETMTAAHLGSPLQRLARLITDTRGSNECFNTNYEDFVKMYRKVTWKLPITDATRQWYYQTCTDFGYYQTNSNKSIFGKPFPLNPLKYFTNLCTDLYGDYYDMKWLNSRVLRTNIMYGGQQLNLTNVIFTNGDVDPWHVLSVLKDLNIYSPAILINGSSHCRDLYSDTPTDVEDLKKARAKVREIIGKWLSP